MMKKHKSHSCSREYDIYQAILYVYNYKLNEWLNQFQHDSSNPHQQCSLVILTSSITKFLQFITIKQFLQKFSQLDRQYPTTPFLVQMFNRCPPQCNSVLVVSISLSWKVKSESTKGEGPSKRHRHLIIKTMLCSILRT